MFSAGARYPYSSPGGQYNIVEAGFAQQLLEYSPDALLLVGPDGSISFLNTAAEQLFGYTRAQLLGADHSLLLAEASREEFHGVLAGLAKAASSRQPRPPAPRSPARAAAGRHRTPGRNHVLAGSRPAGAADAGTSVALSRSAAPQGGTRAPTAPGVPSAATSAVVLLVQRELRAPGVQRRPAPAAFAGHDDELKAGSLRDPLTALPNGPFFNERLAAALRRPDPVDILLLDLDDFKHLNDVLGRSAADELLVEVAQPAAQLRPPA